MSTVSGSLRRGECCACGHPLAGLPGQRQQLVAVQGQRFRQSYDGCFRRWRHKPALDLAEVRGDDESELVGERHEDDAASEDVTSELGVRGDAAAEWPSYE